MLLPMNGYAIFTVFSDENYFNDYKSIINYYTLNNNNNNNINLLLYL